MTAASNIPRDIQESIRDILDKHVKVSFKRLIKMEIRPDKMESRILALSPCRLFLLTAKVPSKLECSFHFLDIQAIESKKPNQLILIVEGKTYTFISVEANSDDMDHIITHIGTSLKQIFPSFPLERLIVKIDVQPGDRLKTMTDMIKTAETKELAPCGGFTMMYQCMCDYYSLPFRDEVAWDVDTIYHSHDSRELRLQDFDHLSGKELVPIIGALEHNAWFKRLNASNVKLTGEACNEIIKVMKRNAVLEEVSLSNTGIKTEFVQKFALAILSNSGSQLTSLDLSNNLLEDKAIFHLLGTIKLLPCGLTSLDISKTGITTRCLNRVGEVLLQAPNVLAGLNSLKINDNGFKGDDFPMLYTCLAQPNAITYLDVSFTDCALDALCDPLLRGCPNLATLKASRTVFTHKRNKDVSVPMSWKQLFSSMCCLEHLDLSNCRLPVEALKDLMLGLSSNRNVKGVYLDLSSNEFGVAGANVLASCIASVMSIKGLDISNNGFDIDLKGLLPEIAKNSHLKHLSIGRNFANIKPKYMPDVMDAFTLLLQEESSGLESLSLADSKLRADTTYIINALGSNNSLQEIDISGNLIGDLGARLLAKALLINTKLSTVIWDKNGVSAQGFEDVAEALQKNMTLKKMPYPINDAAAALRVFPERTEIALGKIESFLQRNHSPRRFASDNAYRLQQGFLINSTQQILDRIVVQVQDTVNALRSLGTVDVYKQELEAADKLIADANNSRQLFSGLQNIAIQSQVKDNSVDLQLQEMANSLRKTIEEQLQKTANEMLNCTQNFCPEIMTNSSFQSTVKEGCLSKVTLPRDFTQGVLEGASTDIYNISSERNLENAAFISDSVIEAVVDSLTSCHKELASHLNLRRSGHYAEKDQNKIEDSSETALLKNGEVSPKLVKKRKSVLTRKTRPQSTVVHDSKMTLASDGEHHPETSVSPSLTISADDESMVSLSRSAVQDRDDLQGLEKTRTECTTPVPAEQTNDIVDLPSVSRPLEHVTKARPRREKMHRPTRPIIDTGTTVMEEEISNGPQRSINTQASHSGEHKDVVSKEVKEETSVTSQKPELLKTKPEDATGKKWMPGFMKKSKEDKQEKEYKDTKKSSFGTSFSNIFKKKDDKRRPSASEADIKVDMTASSIIEQESTFTESLEVVREAEINLDSVAESVKVAEVAPEVEIPGQKCQPVPKSPREKPAFDRVAILPPFKKLETRATTLATAEDTTLEVTHTELEDKATLAVSVPPSNETESHKDEGSKLPTNLSKMSGLGVLGGKNLLHEIKLTQEKRLSRAHTLEEDESNSPKAREVSKKTGEDSQREQDIESATNDAKRISKFKQLPEPASGDGLSKKDLNDNTSDLAPTGLPAKPLLPHQQSKTPTLVPRTKRPVSTVEEGGHVQEVPHSMTASTPELLLGDSPGSKSRPTPPVKPRPPVLPRPKKRDSGKDFGAEETLASEGMLPAAIKSPSLVTSQTDVTESHCSQVSDIELRTKLGHQEEGVVTDSATLRLSVKDKIKRLSQAKGGTGSQSQATVSVQQKTSSLPRDTSLTENIAEELEGNGKGKAEAATPEQDNSAPGGGGEDKPVCSQTSDSSLLGQPDDEIMV